MDLCVQVTKRKMLKMTGEVMPQDPSKLGGNTITEDFKTFGEYEGLGVGAIDPAERTDINPETVKQMLHEVARGDFNVPVSNNYIVWCVDTRLRADGTRDDNPCGAGGFFSLVYARAMTPSKLIMPSTDVELTRSTGKSLNSQGIEMGVHGGDHSDCDCGACAKAKAATGLIIAHGSSLRSVLGDIGVESTDSQHQEVVETTKSLHKNGFFVDNRPSVIEAAKSQGAQYEHLIGVHDELGLAINTIPMTTISRPAIYAKYGPGYGLFVLDAWALASSAELINLTGYQEETDQLTIAMAYYNASVAAQLSGPSMPIIPVLR